MLRVENITKRFGNFLSVDNVSFSIEKGDVVGLLGANGAGKSTTMNMISGYFPQTSGSIRIYDHDILADPLLYKKHIGYLPEFPPLYRDMTVFEQLFLVCGLKGIPRSGREEEIDRVCRLSRIEDVKKRIIGNLSKGYRQRVGLSQALIGNPELLILDEPTAGLDPQQIIDMRELVADLQKSHNIIISSHVLPEISSLCNRILVMKNGRLVADDTPANLVRSFSGENLLELRVMGDRGKVQQVIERIAGVEYCIPEECVEEACTDYTVKAANGIDLRKTLFTTLAEVSCPILLMKAKNPTLEDIFIELTAQ